MSTEKGNKLIAEFMGLEHTTKKYWKIGDVTGNNQLFDLHYHKSWDWIMPVIEKIKEMQHDPSECFMGTTVDRAHHFYLVGNLPIYTPIVTVWEAVVYFVQWYNIQVDEKLINKQKYQ